MNRKIACQILGVLPDIPERELKSKYRALMNLTHPDSNKDSDYPYDAYEINEAYGYLMSHPFSRKAKKTQESSKKVKWNAPINANAYCERDIYLFLTIDCCLESFLYLKDNVFR